MEGEWKTLPLEDCMAAIIDYRGKTPTKTSFGVPLVTAKVIKGGRIERPDEFIAEEDYDTWMRRGMPERGDVVMTTEAPLGEVAQLDGTKVALAQRVITLRGKRDLLDNTFLKFLLQSAEVQEELRSRGTGTTVVGIRQSELRKVSLTLPPLPEQKAIAAVLGALDDKIELNRRMNATLEAMARALFQSWFVDFDPVRRNMDRAGKKSSASSDEALAKLDALFPDSFQDSELGHIPTGWTYSALPDLTTFKEGPGILAKDFHELGVPLIRLAGLINGISLLAGCNFLAPEMVNQKWSHFRLEKGDVLLSTSASLGRVAEVEEEAVGAIPYTGLIAFRARPNRTNQRYIRHYLTSPHFQRQVEAMGVGSVLRHFGPTHLKSMSVLEPPLAIQRAFSDFVAPLDQKVARNLMESRTLATLRDTLLPKMLSGELTTHEPLSSSE